MRKAKLRKRNLSLLHCLFLPMWEAITHTKANWMEDACFKGHKGIWHQDFPKGSLGLSFDTKFPNWGTIFISLIWAHKIQRKEMSSFIFWVDLKNLKWDSQVMMNGGCFSFHLKRLLVPHACIMITEKERILYMNSRYIKNGDLWEVTLYWSDDSFWDEFNIPSSLLSKYINIM